MATLLPGNFRTLAQSERRRAVVAAAQLSADEEKTVAEGSLAPELAERMIENVIGRFSLPLAVATNFCVNGKDYIIPMVIEEASVVAAASNAAKLARPSGGFSASATDPIMIAQIQVVAMPDVAAAAAAVTAASGELVALADQAFPSMRQFGGGARGIEVRQIASKRGPMLVVHLLVDVRDAMGANSVNSMAEGISPRIEQLTGGRTRLRIISNLAVHRRFRARAVWRRDDLQRFATDACRDVVAGILDAWAFAEADQFRATTHNKGILNGVDAVVVATGNDWRAVDAGAHSFAAYNRRYTSLTTYSADADGNLVGDIELPLAIGKIGGITGSHPGAKACLKILGVATANEFGQVLAAVGLAQNFAALRALATEGIQRGHMKLHARNIAVMAGAPADRVDALCAEMARLGRIDVVTARELLARAASGGAPSSASTASTATATTASTAASAAATPRARL